ncbi:hypothetical protein MGAST_28835 [Mycobacterium gastri 'Wayne']|uniref:Uncharacterized protein n=1 Tax=Mycobacterium gastri TaxID=1777 RepID=A0A1X1VE08_MYCGS|nr:hypothetical protein MGAST_28835 [Mycobacterium gastri 'Wayne']ORV67273.1 hypothetical protein AWC07_09705 [Mycobacterium gastri]
MRDPVTDDTAAGDPATDDTAAGDPAAHDTAAAGDPTAYDTAAGGPTTTSEAHTTPGARATSQTHSQARTAHRQSSGGTKGPEGTGDAEVIDHYTLRATPRTTAVTLRGA